jgi:hypothetical protein
MKFPARHEEYPPHSSPRRVPAEALRRQARCSDSEEKVFSETSLLIPPEITESAAISFDSFDLETVYESLPGRRDTVLPILPNRGIEGDFRVEPP